MENDNYSQKIDISVGEIEEVLYGEKGTQQDRMRLRLEVAARKPEWKYFKSIFNRVEKLDEFMEENEDLDSLGELASKDRIENVILPDELARTILYECGKCVSLLPDGQMLNGPYGDFEQIPILKVYEKYGGGFLEVLYERGINNTKTPMLIKSYRQALERNEKG